LLEVERQVEDRLRERLLDAQEERDEQAAEAAVAVEEWVDRLELDMRERGLDERWRAARAIVEEQLERSHARRPVARGRRDESRRARSLAADPVLARPEFAGRLRAAAPLREEHPVDLLEQAQRERESSAEPRHAVRHRGDVVRHLLDVFDRDAGRLLVF